MRFVVILIITVNLLAKDYGEMICMKEYRNRTFIEFNSLKEVRKWMRENMFEQVFIRKCNDTEWITYCPFTNCTTNLGGNDRAGNRTPRR